MGKGKIVILDDMTNKEIIQDNLTIDEHFYRLLEGALVYEGFKIIGPVKELDKIAEFVANLKNYYYLEEHNIKAVIIDNQIYGDEHKGEKIVKELRESSIRIPLGLFTIHPVTNINPEVFVNVIYFQKSDDLGQIADTISQHVKAYENRKKKFSIKFLGKLEVLGQDVEFRGNQAKELFCYLIFYRNYPELRNKKNLLEKIYKTKSEIGKEQSLRNDMSNLSKITRDLLQLPQLKMFTISKEGEGSRCMVKNCINDIAIDFDLDYERFMQYKNEGDANNNLDSYKKAMDLYKGHFLSEFIHKDWTNHTRKHYRDRFFEIIDKLIELDCSDIEQIIYKKRFLFDVDEGKKYKKYID